MTRADRTARPPRSHHTTRPRKDTQCVEIRLADIREQPSCTGPPPRRAQGHGPRHPPPPRPVAHPARPARRGRGRRARPLRRGRDDRPRPLPPSRLDAGRGPPAKGSPLALLTHELKASLRLRRTQLLPHPPVLGVGDGVPRLLRRRRPLDLADRRRRGQRARSCSRSSSAPSSGTTSPSSSPGSPRRSRWSAGRARSSTRSWRRCGAGPSCWAPARTRWATASSTRRPCSSSLGAVLRRLDLRSTNVATAAVFVLLGSFSFVGIGMMAAILPLLYVERGRPDDVRHPVLPAARLAASTTRSTVLPQWMQVAVARSRPRRTSSTASGRRCSTATPLTALVGRHRAADRHGHRVHPAGIWAFGRAERYAKRTGKLKRVG